MIAPGSRVGRYEVTSLIGEGGMGQVFRATDSSLRREVALKVLPAAVSVDPDRLARLQREAELLARLNHPHIAQVYGVERADSTTALVMELVEAPTLEQVLTARHGRADAPGLPLEDALAVASQIARALGAAHERGVVHRDLKPANVAVRPDGVVKVLDFGLARAAVADPTAPGQLDSPTLTMQTVSGSGTAAYMSPEQARGRAVDARTDIWAFGVLLFEMLAGCRPFDGADRAETLGAVLRLEPYWAALPAGVPPRVMQVLRACLRKDLSERIASMQDVRLLLEGAFEPAVAPPRATPAARPWRRGLELAAAAVLAGVAVAWVASSPVPEQPVVSFRIQLPDGMLPAVGQLTMSRDGQTIVWAAEEGGAQRLFVRTLDSPEIRPLPGTEGGRDPFFSPDGSAVAFFTGATLKRVSIGGGPATTICVAPSGRGGAWAADDQIVFAPDAATGLFRVPASGGTPEPLTTLDRENGEGSHRHPVILPDGRSILFTVAGASPLDARLAALAPSAERHHIVQENALHVRYVAGHIVYADIQGQLFAAPFDSTALRISGAARPLPDRPVAAVAGYQLAFSDSGWAVSLPSRAQTQSVVLADPAGQRRALGTTPRRFRSISVSPDSRRLAAVVNEGITRDVWLLDLAEPGSVARLTTGGVTGHVIWSPDSATVTYPWLDDGTWQAQSYDVTSRRLRAENFRFREGREPKPLGWLPDRVLMYTTIGPRQVTTTVASGESPRTLGTPPVQGQAEGLSPDGRWQAWVSDRDPSGLTDVHVAAFPGGGVWRQVSRGGGYHPVWAKSGGVLYYRRGQHRVDGALMRVRIDEDGRVGAPEEVGITGFDHGDPVFPTYDVRADGSFVLLVPTKGAQAPHLDVVVNWARLRGLSAER